ncbi:MAG: XdhC family protein [Deltaproteobacteria bacterium]|nr:XdhC family protein [Deltaproteobacteria bacterium]
MKEIFEEILRASRDSSDASLATVVATEGTAPRKEGSKMLVIGGKTLKGMVTIGGCVDAQVIEASEEVARSGTSKLLRMELGEEDAFDIGLTCAGTLRVLVEPVRIDPEIHARIQSLIDEGIPFALLTVTRSSLPSVKPSTKAIITPTGEACGSLGVGRLNQVALSTAKDLLSKGISRVLDLDSDFKQIEGHRHAAVEIFIDIVGYSPDLFIFGAGQVAVPVARLASEAGFRVHVIDTRPMFANRERFPAAKEILVGFPGEIARGREFNQFSFGLLLSHAAKHDLPVLDVLLRSDARYIGVLGSSKRAAALAKRLGKMGFSEGDIARIHIPVGLDIGAETAEQMAVAVLGELLMVRTGKTGKSLKQVKGIPPSS